MPWRKKVRRSAKATCINSEPEGLLHDDPIGIAKISSQNIWIMERSNENPLMESSDLVAFKEYSDTKFNALEAKITNDAQVVSTELDEKFNSYIKIVVEDNNFKNPKLE